MVVATADNNSFFFFYATKNLSQKNEHLQLKMNM